MLPIACSVGNALDLHHARYVCGMTFRLGVRRADGSLDRAGFLGGTADMIRSACRLQGLDAMRAKAREASSATQLMRAAAFRGDEKRVRELVSAGAPLDLIDIVGNSTLHYASKFGRTRIAHLLLDGKYEGAGADTNLQTKLGWTPLFVATIYNHEAVARLLLESGADLTLRDGSSSTVLQWARRRQRAAIVALLEAHGARE